MECHAHQSAHLGGNIIHFTTPLETHSTAHIYDVSGLKTPLKHTLERMGYTVRERQQEAEPLTVTEWRLETDRFFETLPALTELTDSPALSLTHFEIDGNALLQLTTEAHSSKALSASLTLTLNHEDKHPLNL
ncbi:hypothetical protein [Vibrio maritimus]|uniref:hypothetical protein n=1 Tax=Vibrio maritimus TaxID=990268 RepID=UPI001F1E233F|nr:hypothetical protein [Vibrio maritimus]